MYSHPDSLKSYKVRGEVAYKILETPQFLELFWDFGLGLINYKNIEKKKINNNKYSSGTDI